MTVSHPEPQQAGRRTGRWLAIVASVAVVGLAIVLLALLLRRWGPQAEALLWLSPAAAPVDATTAIALSGRGWQPGERVALCLTSPDDERCDDANALAIVTADQTGAIQTDIVAGDQLAQGQTTFAARGLDSDRRASRTFRVLKNPSAPAVVVVTAASETGDQALMDLTDDLRPEDTAQLPQGDGWQAEYFANTSLAGPSALTRAEAELAFDWGAGSPDPLLPADGFSARWTRRVSLPGASQRFSVQADGGVRLFVDGQRLIDQWQDDGRVTTANATVDLAPGDHTVQLEYFQQQGNAAVALTWETIGSYPEWRGEYFDNPDLAGQPALVRNDADLNLDWGENSPAPDIIPADGFSIRWTRALDFTEGAYRFVLTADDGARLLVDGQPVIDAWQDLAGETRTVDRALAGGQHQVTVLFRDLAGPARIFVGWSLVSSATPVQVAGGVATPTPSSVPTPVVTPGETPSATSTPSVTESTTPASPATAEPTATAGTPGAPTVTPTVTPTSDASATPTGSVTATPEGTPSPAPSTTPAGIERRMDINPIMGYAGTRITITSGNWSPGTQVRIALLEQNAPFSQAQDLPIAPFTTPSDSAQSFSLSFQFPDDSRWLSQVFVRVLLHNGDWSEWADELFDIIPP